MYLDALKTQLVFRFLLFSVLVCLACIPSVAAETCSSTATSQNLDNAFGVNIDFTDPRPGEIKMLAAAGFRWVRMDLKWDATETVRGQYDFSAYDRLLSALEKESVRALFILDYGNPLYDDGAPPRTENSRKAFTLWAVAAATHFSNRGILWEIYNEPNHEQFWPPRPNVSDYIALALAVGKAFRDNVPAEKLIGPATSGMDFKFLESCFKQGLLKYLSAVSVHPYRREDPETASADFCRLRRLIDTYAPTAQVPIISGEWGYSTSWSGVSDVKQSELLVRSWLTNVANGVQLSIWYDWRDDGLDKRNSEHNFGTVGNVYRQHVTRPYEPKPAYVAASKLTSFLNSFRLVKRLAVGSENDYVLLFQKGDESRVVAWTVSMTASKVFIPLDAGIYDSTDYLGRTLRTIRSQGGVTITLSNAPVYLHKT